MSVTHMSGAFAPVRSIVRSTAALALLGAAISGAQAQGINDGPVAKTKKAAPCPSGWTVTKDGVTDTGTCFPQGTLSPKIYAKKESDSCASGYYEVSSVWCSTKRP